MADSLPLPPLLAGRLQDLPLDALAFAAVPGRARRDGWTPDRQRGFILRLAIIGGVAAAADGVGMSRESAYRLLARPGAESFAAAWERALEWGRSRVRDLAIERAIIGESRPVFYRGRKVAEKVRYDNALLIAALRAIPIPPPSTIEADRECLNLFVSGLGGAH